MSSKVFVTKQSDLDKLVGYWNAAKEGNPQTVLLTAPFGGGKRAAVAELARLARQENEDVLVFRPVFSEEEEGQNTLIKLYAGILSFLHGNPGLRGKVELALNSRKPSQSARVQNWTTAFLDGMKQGAPKTGEEQFQLHIPQDNPLLGFVELVHQMAAAYPVILELQNIHHTHSLAIVAMIKALVHKNGNAQNTQLLTILSSVSLEENAAWVSMPLQDALKEESEYFQEVALSQWGTEEVTQYLESKEYATDLAEQIATLTSGRPGFIAELADLIQEDAELAKKVATESLDNLYDLSPDADELDSADEEGGENKRKYATAEDADRVAYISALLGMSFPSGIVADMLNLNRSSVDDIFDATDGIYKEVQFSQPLNTWIYQFKSAMIRESVLARHQDEEGKRIAGNSGAFIERFLAPAGYGYALKALHLYADAGLQARADVMRNVALGADQPQMWNLARDIFRYFNKMEWSNQMQRSVYLNMCERMSRMGNPNEAEELLKEAMAWGENLDDSRSFTAFLKLSGSRLDARRQDLFRARQRAQESFDLYKELESPVQQAEAAAQLALVEFNDGNFNAALGKVNEADALTDVVPLRGLTSFIRGLIAQREKKNDDALKHFTQANQMAGQSGRGALALDAGMKMGEVLLGTGKSKEAADVLNQVQQIAQGLKAAPQERTICAMAAQAFASQQNIPAALEKAQRALQISHAMKDQRALPADLYNVGLFQLMSQKPSEAVALLKQARQIADKNNTGLMKEILFHLGMGQDQVGDKGAAEEALISALNPVQAARDVNKAMAIYEKLADIANSKGDKSRAEKMLNNALTVAKQLQNKDLQKRFKERLKNL